MLIEPKVLRAAQDIYEAYVAVHPSRYGEVTGVSMHTETLNGFISFRPKPVLLPDEVFVSVEQLANDRY